MGALLVGGCGRCNRVGAGPEKASAGDAGTPAMRHASIDLRTALFTLFPEFRFATFLYGEAALEREIRFRGDELALRAALAPELGHFGLELLDGGAGREDGGRRDDRGGVWATRPPFVFVGHAEGETARLVLALPLVPDDVGKLLHSPVTLTSEQLATYLPVPAGAERISERFLLQINYRADIERGDFLVHQMVDLLLGGEWRAELPEGWQKEKRPDGGVGAIPARFTLTLRRGQSDTEVFIDRDGTHVHLEYRQPTWY